MAVNVVSLGQSSVHLVDCEIEVEKTFDVTHNVRFEFWRARLL